MGCILAAFKISDLKVRVNLLRKHINTKLSKCDGMEDFVNRKISTSHKLSDTRRTLNDEWIETLKCAIRAG